MYIARVEVAPTRRPVPWASYFRRNMSDPLTAEFMFIGRTWYRTAMQCVVVLPLPFDTLLICAWPFASVIDSALQKKSPTTRNLLAL
jgi:hypothetical protein